MTPAGYALLICSLLHAVAVGFFGYRPSGHLQLLILMLWLLWFFLLLAVRTLRWHKRGSVIVSYALPLSFLIAPVIGGFVGGRVRTAVFRWRLPQYEAAVHAIQQGEQPMGVPDLAYVIAPRKNAAGDLQVLFFWGGGVPVKHTCFLFSSTDPDTDPNLVRDWRGFRPLAPNWYSVSD
jgi:hypothetical protein